MSPKKLFSAMLVSSSLLAGVAHADVTLNPSATNGGAGALSGDAAFQAAGFQSNMYSSLVISGNSGSNVAINEVGYIDVTSFINGSQQTVNSGVFTNYKIRGDFTISGTGNWSGNTITANTAGLNFSVVLTADPGGDGVGPFVNLGTATLAPGPAIAFAIAFGSLNPGDSGLALTSLSALMNFTPAPGTEGIGGFFEAPNPFNIALSIGNAGGNAFNTGYSVDAAGNVTFVNPLPGTNPGTANVTFVQAVPEPGVLSLAAVALIGFGVATRRGKKNQAAA